VRSFPLSPDFEQATPPRRSGVNWIFDRASDKWLYKIVAGGFVALGEDERLAGADGLEHLLADDGLQLGIELLVGGEGHQRGPSPEAAYRMYDALIPRMTAGTGGVSGVRYSPFIVRFELPEIRRQACKLLLADSHQSLGNTL